MSAMRRALAPAAAALLAGCSTLQLAYDNADTYVRWEARAYLDVHDEQSDELDARIAAFHAWHREKALPQYAQLAVEVGRRLERGLSREDLLWGYDAVRAQVRESVRAAAVEAAGLLDRLGPEQLEHLAQRLAEDNRKFAREDLAGTPEERRERRTKRNLERLEDWLGGLSDAQAERVRQYSERAALVDELRDRDRRRRQAEFLDLLRARQARARLADWAADWESGRVPEYAAAVRANLEEYFSMLLDLDRSLSPVQRRTALERLARYRGDIEQLMRPRAARESAQ